jgi:hypothetical protein
MGELVSGADGKKNREADESDHKEPYRQYRGRREGGKSQRSILGADRIKN